MNVTHIISSNGLYGAEIMLLNLMNEQQRMGMNPLLISLGQVFDENDQVADEAVRRGLAVMPYKMRRGYSLRSALRITDLARRGSAPIIHSHGYKGSILLGSLPRRLRRVPMVRTLHGWTAMKTLSGIGLYEALDRFILRSTDAVVQVRAQGAGNGADSGSPGAGKRVIENGIPELDFDGGERFRADPVVRDFCKEGYVIGVVSRLSEEKGLVTFLETMHELSSVRAGFKAVIIGEGPQRALLEKTIRDRGLSGSVLLAGYRRDAWHYLPFFKVLVLPSYTEGLPITLLEAMQSGTPIVATAVGGVPNVLGEGKFGLLVKPGDPKALAEAIATIRTSGEEATARARLARGEVFTRYSSRRMAEEYRQVYEAVLHGWKEKRSP